jgi:hypothetical protein
VEGADASDVDDEGEEQPAPPASDNPPRPNMASGTVLIDKLNFRAGPGTEFAMVRQFDLEERVSIVGISHDGEWVAVTTLGATNRMELGWAFAEPAWIDVSVDLDTLPLFAGPGFWLIDAEGVQAPRFLGAGISGAHWEGDQAADVSYIIDGVVETVRAASGELVQTGGSPPNETEGGLRFETERTETGLYLRILDRAGSVVAQTPLGLLGRDAPIDPPPYAWSPSERLLLVWDLDNRAESVEIDGRGATPILILEPGAEARTIAHGSAPQWMPDGSVLYLEGRRLRRVDVQGEPQPLAIEVETANFFVSPDGRYVAVGEETAARVIALDGSRELGAGDGTISSRSWSRDSRYLALTRRVEVIIFDTLSGLSRVVPVTRTFVGNVRWNNDQLLAYPETLRFQPPPGGPIGPSMLGRISIVGAQSGGPSPLIHAYNGIDMEWSPDGRWLLISSSPDYV